MISLYNCASYVLPTPFSCRKIGISGGLLTSREPCQGFCSHAIVRKHSLEYIGDPAEAAGAITVPGASPQGELRWEGASQDRGKATSLLGGNEVHMLPRGDTPWSNEETAKQQDGEKGGWLARGTPGKRGKANSAPPVGQAEDNGTEYPNPT